MNPEIIYSLEIGDEKNERDASQFRQNGNRFYNQSKFFEALEGYNKCLCLAPKSSSEIPLAYANRSAVYLEVKEYQLCLENIQLSRDSGYPAEKIQTLNDREEKCKKLMTEDPADPNNDPWSFFKLSYPANEKIPFIVDCLELKENKAFGRHIVTNRDLKPGDIIAIETPFAKTVSVPCRHLRCTNCLKSNKMSLIPTERSTRVMFCSTLCLEAATKIFLQYEWKCELNDVNHRVFREALEVCGGSFDKLNQLLVDPELSRKTIFDFDLSDERDSLHKYHLLLAFNGLFEGPWHRDMSYIKHSPALDLLHNQKQKETAEAFMLRSFKILTMNSFGIEWLARSHNKRTVASTMLIFGGLLNMSCLPNVQWLYVDNKFIFVVRQSIRVGEQLFISNGREFFCTPRDQRKGHNLHRFGFNCTCEACNRNVAPFTRSYQSPYIEDILEEDSTTADQKKRFQRNCDKIRAEGKKLPSFEICKLMEKNMVLMAAIAKVEPFIF